MNYHIDKQQGKAYMQLYLALRRDIVEGIYPYGTRLPSKRLLAEEAGVSVITVEHAYNILADEGYIESRERSGYFAVYRERDFSNVARPALALKRTNVHTAGGDFPFGVLSKTMRRVLADYGERILVKSPNHGCPELRSAVANYLKRSAGMNVRAEQVIIGSGAEYLYSLIAQLLSGYRFALESPSYDKIRRVYTACGSAYEMLKMGSDGIRSEELEKSKAQVLHITPFHSYPSGVTATVSKRKEYIVWAAVRDGYIIEDNFDSELTVSSKSEDTVFSMAENRVIYLNTFSSTVAPAIRVGYMVLPEGLLAQFEKKLGFYSCTVPVFEQYVLAELIDKGDFERHIHRVRRARRKSSGYIK